MESRGNARHHISDAAPDLPVMAIAAFSLWMN